MKKTRKIKTKIRNFIKKRLPYFNPLIDLVWGKENERIQPIFKGTDYLDPTKQIEEKRKYERRRRTQVSTVLEYCFNSYTYYDYFTTDTLKILKNAYVLTEFLNKEFVDTDVLLFAFCRVKGCVSMILEKYGLTKNEIQEVLGFSLLENPEQIEIIEKQKKEYFVRFLIQPFLSFFSVQESKQEEKKFVTTEEFDELLEKAAEAALKKYKTPVISSEILFLTLMEEKHLKGGKILKSLLESTENESIWHLIRYDLLRSLYHDEAGIRTQLSGNEHYYAYLLKTQIPELKFKKMIHYRRIPSTLSMFRNELIKQVLKLNIAKMIRKDVRRTMKINTTNTKRIYYDLESQEKQK